MVSRSTQARVWLAGLVSACVCLPLVLEEVVYHVMTFLGEAHGLWIREDLNGSTLYQTLSLGRYMPRLPPLC